MFNWESLSEELPLSKDAQQQRSSEAEQNSESGKWLQKWRGGLWGLSSRRDPRPWYRLQKRLRSGESFQNFQYKHLIGIPFQVDASVPIILNGEPVFNINEQWSKPIMGQLKIFSPEDNFETGMNCPCFALRKCDEKKRKSKREKCVADCAKSCQ